MGELRRTLELLLADKGATKWGLGDKIEEIAQKGLLPDVLKEASQYIKTLGDSAVHNKKDHVDQMEVEAMTEFVGYIIEYLYIVPEKIASFSAQTGIKPAN